MVTSVHNQNDIIYAIGQSFVIIGWVALWRPVEFYLYDRRDLVNDKKMLLHLETIQIETRRWDKKT